MRTLVDPRELVGSKEAVAISGLSRQRFTTLVNERSVPDPIATLACGPIWTRSQIEEWAAEYATRRP